MEQSGHRRIAMAGNDEECIMRMKGSSLTEPRDAGTARKIMRAQDATVQALDEVRRTTQVLRTNIDEARSRGFSSRRYLSVDHAAPRLPQRGDRAAVPENQRVPEFLRPSCRWFGPQWIIASANFSPRLPILCLSAL